MNIVKQFEDPEYLLKAFPDKAPSFKWYWGLGDNGDVYYMFTYFGDDWAQVRDGGACCCVSLKTMRKIIKEFAHWLPFI